MSFKLCSYIELGSFKLRGGINEVTAKRSVNDYMDTAIIKIPALGRTFSDSNMPSTSIESAKMFKEGDKVLIQLGYNGDYRKEFQGFIRRVSPSVPVVIECEGYGWQLRRQRILKSWKATTLLEVLETLIQGTDIVLSPFIPEIKLTNYSIRNSNGLEVLEYFKSKMLLTCYFTFNELYVGIQQGLIKETVKLRLGWNVLRDDQLKYRLAEDTRILVRLTTGKGKKNKRLLYETGDKDGSLREINVPNIQDQQWLKNLGDDALQKAKYTGYEGSITCFLQPYIEPSCNASIIDRRYDRSGSHFTISTEVTFGMRGGRRKVQLGSKLN